MSTLFHVTCACKTNVCHHTRTGTGSCRACSIELNSGFAVEQKGSVPVRRAFFLLLVMIVDCVSGCNWVRTRVLVNQMHFQRPVHPWCGANSTVEGLASSLIIIVTLSFCFGFNGLDSWADHE